jgi:hypothetical protein
MRVCVIWIGLFVFAASVRGADGPHKEMIINALKYEAWSGQSINFPFVSELQTQREVRSFKKINGDDFLSVSPRVTSAYDSTSAPYEITPFYTSKSTRTRWVVNYFIPSTSILLSAGYDSGSDADKITVNASKFFGLSTFWRLSTQSAAYLIVGAWDQQDVTERPCIDSYDREYWCANLTAWSDHVPLESAQFNFIQLKYELRF